jgi:hypothetical protein
MNITDSFTNSLGLIKSLLEFFSQTKDFTHSEELVDAKDSLVELKQIIVDLKESVLEKDEEIKAWKNSLVLEKEMQFEKYFYYHKMEDGSKEGPFCPTCYDSKKEIVHLLPINRGLWECGVCKNTIRDDVWYLETINNRGNKLWTE